MRTNAVTSIETMDGGIADARKAEELMFLVSQAILCLEARIEKFKEDYCELNRLVRKPDTERIGSVCSRLRIRVCSDLISDPRVQEKFQKLLCE